MEKHNETNQQQGTGWSNHHRIGTDHYSFFVSDGRNQQITAPAGAEWRLTMYTKKPLTIVLKQKDYIGLPASVAGEYLLNPYGSWVEARSYSVSKWDETKRDFVSFYHPEIPSELFTEIRRHTKYTGTIRLR